MQVADPQRVLELRAIIAEFLKGRLEAKLDKLEGGSGDEHALRAELAAAHEPGAWLADAARRVGQIQAVTHSLKPVHPDAKGTTLYRPPAGMAAQEEVGSHALGTDFAGDVVGNAAALDVYKFLRLEHQGRSLLDLALARDVDLSAALSSKADEASAWLDAFAGLIEARGNLASHSLAKQIYWPVGDDPHDDSQYHLLAPLYASSLAHRVWQQIQGDRFSDDARQARKARKEDLWSERPVREYPNLAVQQLGGTKPQNISQLNSERRGVNYLLASLPPVWQSTEITPLYASSSMFQRYGRREEVRRTVRTLTHFLKTDPTPNTDTRTRRAALVDVLIDELLQFSAEIRTGLPPGWSQSADCGLDVAQRHWLDPDGVAQACAQRGVPLPADTAERISTAFALWLNAQLRDRAGSGLPLGDAEALTWRKQMLDEIEADGRRGGDDD